MLRENVISIQRMVLALVVSVLVLIGCAMNFSQNGNVTPSSGNNQNTGSDSNSNQNVSGKPQLIAEVEKYVPGLQLKVSWITNNNNQYSTQNEKATFTWNASKKEVTKISLYVQSAGDKPILFAEGGYNGSATTGLWVQAGQKFILETPGKKVLATAIIGKAD